MGSLAVSTGSASSAAVSAEESPTPATDATVVSWAVLGVAGFGGSCTAKTFTGNGLLRVAAATAGSWTDDQSKLPRFSETTCRRPLVHPFRRRSIGAAA